MTLRRLLFVCLLLAVMATQSLGVMHAVVHLPRQGEAHGEAYSETHNPARNEARSEAHNDAPADLHRAYAPGGPHAQHSVVHDLFGGHGDDFDCQLYDQLSHGNGPPRVAVVVLPVLLPVFLFQHFQGDAVARWATLFDARGPPPLR
jgi:hypothetical protein